MENALSKLTPTKEVTYFGHWYDFVAVESNFDSELKVLPSRDISAPAQSLDDG